MNNYPQVVQDIHNEFNLAGEKLLQDSLAIIQNAEKVDIQKAFRLNEVGFSNNPLLAKAKQIEEVTRTPALMAQIVMDYKRQFPLNKFISDNDVDKICAKYKLVKGNTEQFTGFVPEKNLQEIEVFKKQLALNKRFHINAIELKYSATQGYAKLAIQNYVESHKSGFLGKNIEDVKNQIEINSITPREYGRIHTTIKSYVELPIFDICAPKKDMISNEKYSLLKGLFELTVSVAPDPVVLYPVEHGYIIVTAWGDEATDPLVVKENLN